MTSRRVFFYVQHLLGVGHLFRAVRIAHGLRDAGFVVDLALGGNPLAGLDLSGLNVIQLPPLKAGPEGFSNLITVAGEPANSEIKSRRIADLLAGFEQSRPDVLLVETFPFGRRQMRFELMPLLEAAHRQKPRPRIVSSIRDLLQEGKTPERARETVELLRAYFDLVLVHGDPQLVPLGATFPLGDDIRPMVVYSGIVAPARPAPGNSSEAIADVIVSAGGGAVGQKLLETAISAKPATALGCGRWLALAGPNAELNELKRLEEIGAINGVTVRRSTPDLVSALAGARLSISQAGYNTVADVLTAACRAVFVPFAQAGETEQTRRAELLEKHGLGVMLTEEALTTGTLAEAIDRALALPRLPSVVVDLEGASKTAQILLNLLAEKHKP